MARIQAFLRRVLPLLLNFRVWVPVLGIVVTSCLAHGLIASTGRMHDFAIVFLDVLGKLGLYTAAGVASVGVVAAAAWERPRKSLADMTDAEREEVFKSNPQVRARWEEQQKLLATPPRAGSG